MEELECRSFCDAGKRGMGACFFNLYWEENKFVCPISLWYNRKYAEGEKDGFNEFLS